MSTVTPPQLKDVGFKQRLDEILPLDAAFRDDRGRSATLGQFFGRKPVLLAFVYYQCPMLCTQVMNLVRLGGVMTVLFMGGFILMMRRRESRPPASSRWRTGHEAVTFYVVRHPAFP